MAIFQLTDETSYFPNPYMGEGDGCLAVGGDLSVERLISAYQQGIFPWYAYDDLDTPLWYCPLQRYVIFPSEIHVSHSMRQLLRKGCYEVTFGQDFEGVIQGCASAQGRDVQQGAWLGPNIIEAYTRLHRAGYATSVEVWEPATSSSPRRLIGGLYGVYMGTAFFGESMFSLVPNASKLALIYLAKEFLKGNYFIDCQFYTSHFQSMGGCYISYEEYMTLLASYDLGSRSPLLIEEEWD